MIFCVRLLVKVDLDRDKSKKARHAKISHELRQILGGQAAAVLKKRVAPPKPKLLQVGGLISELDGLEINNWFQDALKEQEQDKERQAKAQAKIAASQKARVVRHIKHMTATTKEGRQVHRKQIKEICHTF